MIYDTIPMLKHYSSLNRHVRTAVDFLNETDLSVLEVGRVDIDGDDVFGMVSLTIGNGKSNVKLETHKKYIDIQIVIDGEDVIGWAPLEKVKGDGYDEVNDLEFSSSQITNWFQLKQNEFAIFFPEDAHAPCASTNELKRLVLKLKCD